MPKDEFELIDLAKKGDHTALTALVKRYSPRIYNLGLRMMRAPEDAEDVLQETFLTMVKKIQTFKGQSSLYTWLYRIAMNISLEKLKDKHRTNITASIDDPLYENLGRFEPLDLPDKDKLDAGQFRQYLDTAMEALNAKLRAVFILRDIEGQSIAETAKILGLTESNVKVRLMRARLILRDKLSEIMKAEEWYDQV
ncbi:MAG: sigma-70 family RNA polymerase sigma factor [FCB group bacterium]|nr:sigma-70 family RNA polymerase sigma factor [FCB group bacterium]